MHIIPCVCREVSVGCLKNSLQFVKSTHYPAVTPSHNVGSNHHPERVYLQLPEAHRKMSLIFLMKHADHRSAELMISHPLNNPRQRHRSDLLYTLV